MMNWINSLKWTNLRANWKMFVKTLTYDEKTERRNKTIFKVKAYKKEI